MNKPMKEAQAPCYDFRTCTAYLEAQGRFDHRDYAGKYTSGEPGRPYRDFWHFILDKDPEVTNGGIICMAEWWGEDAEDWQRELLGKYLAAFGERDPFTDELVAEFRVDW